jgi:hypothetical protein
MLDAMNFKPFLFGCGSCKAFKITAGVKTLAIYVAGRNSRIFQVASHLSYALRVALIFFETKRKMNKPVTVRVAEPVECATMGKGDVVAWLRARTYAMAEPGGPEADYVFNFPPRISV